MSPLLAHEEHIAERRQKPVRHRIFGKKAEPRGNPDRNPPSLYAFIRAREPGGERWWIAVGVTAGLGRRAKYAMAYWLLSASGSVLRVREERRPLPRLLVAG